MENATVALQTERLALRPYQDSDAVEIHAYASNPIVTRYTLWGPNTEDETRAFLADVTAGEDAIPRIKYDFAIALREDGRMVGGCGIYLRGAERLIGEVGYVLHPDFHRRGLMPEAVMALLKFGFESLCLNRIFARCHPDNRPSARVMEKCGMQYEGRLRESEFAKGEWWDFLHYSILAREWNANR